MTDRLGGARVPPHVVVMLSAVTAGYAGTLATVAAIQARTEVEVAAARTPTSEGLERLARAHDELAARLDAARAAYAGAADAYDRAAGVLALVDADLAALAGTVADIDGVSRTLPTRVAAPVQRTVVRVSPPATHATTRASGG